MGSRWILSSTICATLLRHGWRKRGLTWRLLPLILGHSSIRMVQRYVHVTAEHKKAAMIRYEADQNARAKAEQEGRPN